MKLIRELRLLPVVLFAIVCLLALKVLGFLVDDRTPLVDGDAVSSASDQRSLTAGRETYAPRSPQPPSGKAPWAREMFNFPDVTGSLAAEKQAEKNAGKAAEKGDAKPSPPAQSETPASGGKPVIINQGPPVPPGERAVLERLQERRHEIEARARELEIRENLLKAAEQQLEIRINELKEAEARLQTAAVRKDEAEAQRFKGLVTMYENMRAKDAAKIFDRLDLRVLVEVASLINPRRMSDILAQMQAEAAERLTVELANRAGAVPRPAAATELPKIEGRAKAP